MTIPLRVYSPADGTGQLSPDGARPSTGPTTQTEVTKAGDVKVYASTGTDMVARCH